METMHHNTKYTNEQLINIMKEYAGKVKFPTIRDFTPKNNLPSATTYIDRFGSFQNAIIESGIEIPQSKLKYFNREILDDDNILKLLKIEVDKKLKDENRLLTADEINQNTNLPSFSSYNRRFGSLAKTYEKLGFDISYVDIELKRNELKQKYLELAKLLGKTPNSREIDKHSKLGFCPAMKTYDTYFGSLFELQSICELTPTVIGRNKSREELLDDLRMMADELEKTPSQLDVVFFDTVASCRAYVSEFGSWTNAIKEAGLTPITKKYYSYNGTLCLSYYELLFTNMLEKFNIYFEKEVPYKEYINTDKRYRFDFMITINQVKYFIEIFGMIDNKDYEQRIEIKKSICKKNKLHLIEIYPKDFTSYKLDDIQKMFQEKIS